MIKKMHIEELVKGCLDNNTFIVDISVSNTNHIKVFIDSYDGISIDECVRVSRCIEHQLDRDMEDFSLEISSAGLQKPFKVIQQYKKHEGKEVEVITHDGRKWRGKLIAHDKDEIILLPQIFEKGKKSGLTTSNDETKKIIAYSDIKSTKLIINF